MKRTIEKGDIDWEKLVGYIRTARLPNPPKGIIPPPIKLFYDYTYLNDPAPSYDESSDYWGKSLDEIEAAMKRLLDSWDYVKQVGIWLSGGIDSSLLAYYAAKLLGTDRVIAYNLSFGGNTEYEADIARAVADKIGIKFNHRTMVPQEAIELIPTGTIDFRAPCLCPHVTLISKMCKLDGTEKALIGLNLDALTGGELAHTKAKTLEEFQKVERDIWNLQMDFVWINVYQSQRYLELRMPYMDPIFASYMKSIPWEQKTANGMTKSRIRQEIASAKILPDVSTQYGKVGGSKRGFCPDWNEWIASSPELREWINSKTLPQNLMESLGSWYKNWKNNANPWLKMMCACTAEFLELIDKGEFTVDE